ncbi:uncharacterized protein CIMG_00207 [Coccidioides immitis RS]|uniref:Uncharacterized protein n=1 Tax=Coccidioides immitis (strain RS) TaxID=246410 RepID=J3KGI3_COCIM|nr:uncharacterized protein CIMG_00207 [Coccidioides immitis RS]EAS34853.3 hypothetical protein CIMG_00207 [Coccidioides immitis RS]
MRDNVPVKYLPLALCSGRAGPASSASYTGPYYGKIRRKHSFRKAEGGSRLFLASQSPDAGSRGRRWLAVSVSSPTALFGSCTASRANSNSDQEQRASGTVLQLQDSQAIPLLKAGFYQLSYGLFLQEGRNA